jgi:hypothetical protein
LVRATAGSISAVMISGASGPADASSSPPQSMMRLWPMKRKPRSSPTRLQAA